MEFEDNDEQEEEMGLHEDAVYDSPPHHPPPGNPSRFIKTAMESPEAVGTAGGMMVVRPRYRECLKNHAVGIGGHAVDGCGEFMPAGAEGTIDALRCAACGCHRNFHRKEMADTPSHHNRQPHLALPPPGYYRLPPPAGYFHHQRPLPPQPPPLQLALPPPPVPSHERERGDEYNEGHEDMVETAAGGGRKRFRTKFTAEQKEKMLDLAERIGWRIQKQDEELVRQFCEETGVTKQVLKVWLHNNKQTFGKIQHHHQQPP